MAEIYNGPLTHDDDWASVVRNGVSLPASGQAVQQFIKDNFTKSLDKIGYLYTIEDNAQNGTRLFAFKNAEDFAEWDELYEDKLSNDALNNEKVLQHMLFAKAEKTESTYTVSLGNKTEDANGTIVNTIVSTDNTIKLSFQFDSIEYPPVGDPLPTGNSGTIEIQKRNNSSDQWASIDTSSLQSAIPNYDNIESGKGQIIDVTSLLKNGYQELRMRITDNETGKKTSYLVFYLTKTNLSAEFKTSWEIPQRDGKMSLKFVVLGQDVDKYLHLRISGPGHSTEVREYSVNIGTISDTSGKDIVITDSNAYKYKVSAHGVHNIEYWVSVGNNNNDPKQIRTVSKFAQIMMATDASNTDPFIILNNVKSELVNWTKETLFDFSIYNGGKNLKFPLSMELMGGDGSSYLTYNEEVDVETKLTFNNTLEIEADEEVILGRMYFKNYNTQEQLRDYLQFNINNLGAFSPTSGADFVLNPKSRSNTDGKTQKIFNDATGEEVIHIDKNNISHKTTWANFNFNNTDGWISDDQNNKCLRVLAGQQVIIPYYPLNNLREDSCTIELSIATRNITDDTKSLLSIGSYEKIGDSNNLNGFELRPLSAVFMTGQDVDNQSARDSKDIMFAENTKTHIAINIYKNIYTAGEDFPLQYKDLIDENSRKIRQNVNLVRLYINGRINREFVFNDSLEDRDSVKNIIIGNLEGGADIDVYGIRVYKKQLQSKHILQDYISSLPTIVEKQKELEKNDILDSNGMFIDYDKVKGKYNTLLWESNSLNGKEFGHSEKKNGITGNLHISILSNEVDVNGNYIPYSKYSGVINDMETEGQGTSAMTYWKWNQRWKFSDASKFTNLDGETMKKRYKLNDIDPDIKRLDGKINWASPMQSHKIGSTSLYNDLWKIIVGSNLLTDLNSLSSFEKLHELNIPIDGDTGEKMTPQQMFENACKFTGLDNGYEACRVAVRQEPFMLFWKHPDIDEPIFYGLYTWGASKGDKPTFGFNEDFNSNFVMIEGTDNDRALVMYRVPWDDAHVTQPMKKGEVDGGNLYGGEEQFEISMGNAAEDIIGQNWEGSVDNNNPCLKMFKDMANFIYLCNPHIHYFDGTLEEMKEKYASEPSFFDIDDFYWTDDYKLYRFNGVDVDKEIGLNGQWVNAGLWNDTNNDYDPIDLREQTGESVFYGKEEANKKFIEGRVKIFKEGIGKYIHINDLLFTMQFLKLIAATDNWGKNTYIYNTGLYDNNGELDKFRFFQDDLDTIFEIDNSGFKAKPYYVEEHDVNGEGKPYWNSSNNALYCLAEMAFDVDMRNMMNSILSSMANMKKSDGSQTGSVQNCFEYYYQDKAQNYFPAVAYNEVAKLLYEDAYCREANHAVDPLSQCLGDQTQAERQWQDMRSIYMSSYASYGEFGAAGGVGSTGAFVLRSADVDYNFELTPYMWMYPSCALGSSSINYGGGAYPERVRAGETININISNPGNDTQCIIRGVNYMTNIGNFARHAVNPSHEIVMFGERLEKFEVVGDNKNPILFAPSRFSISNGADMNCIKEFNISGKVDQGKKVIPDTVDLSRLWRLEKVDITSSSISKLSLPGNSNINTLRLPSTIQSLILDNQTRLTNDNFYLDSVELLKDLTIYNTNINEYQLVNRCMVEKSGDIKLNELNLSGIDWKDVDMDMINYILDINKCNISGKIYMKSDASISFKEKSLLMSKFGNIDDVNNELYVNYTVNNGGDWEVTGQTYLSESGVYRYSSSYTGNNFSEVIWELDSDYDYVSMDDNGLLTFTKPDVEDKTATCEVKCTIIRTGGLTPTESIKTVHLYKKDAEIGDYVYADGTYGLASDDNGQKTVIGICCHVDENYRLAVATELAYTEENSICWWGLDSGNNFLNSTDNNLINIPNLRNTSSSGASTSDMPPGESYPDYYICIQSSDPTKLGKYHGGDKNYSLNDIGLGSLGFDFKIGNSQSNNIEYPKGSILPAGQINTLAIIDHRNNVSIPNAKNNGNLGNIRNSFSIPGVTNNKYDGIEAELSTLKNIEEISKNSSFQNVQNYMYLPASYCYAYRPVNLKEGEKLNENLFGPHKWFLPSLGELAEIYYYCRTNDIFSNIYSTVVGNSVKLWSSSESSYSNGVWSIRFIYDKNYNTTSRLYGVVEPNKGSGDNSYKGKVLPVVRF